MDKVAVIILNWNGEKLLREFLPSVLRNTNKALGRVIVVDNHSTDSSLEVLQKEFPTTECIVFDQNYGFAGGYNAAIKQIETEYVVLLNSDVEVAPGWLEPLVKQLDENSEVVAVQPKILSWKQKDCFEYAGACGGYIDRYGFPFCRGRLLSVTEKDKGQYEDETEIFWGSGAALCIRREAYLECGGLDEAFFAHMEEIDLCWRLRNAGHHLKVVPASVVYHLGGASLPMNHPRKLFLNYRNNLLMLYKNLPADKRRCVLRIRVFLDITAAVVFLLKGQWSNVKAIRDAYSAYRKLRKNYKLTCVSRVEDSCIFPGSLVWNYFVRGVKSFEVLQKKWRKMNLINRA